jgi:hypothetical protein
MALEKTNWHSKPDFYWKYTGCLRELHAMGLFFDLSKAYDVINHTVVNPGHSSLFF